MHSTIDILPSLLRCHDRTEDPGRDRPSKDASRKKRPKPRKRKSCTWRCFVRPEGVQHPPHMASGSSCRRGLVSMVASAWPSQCRHSSALRALLMRLSGPLGSSALVCLSVCHLQCSQLFKSAKRLDWSTKLF